MSSAPSSGRALPDPHERCWDLRHRDPEGFARALATLPPGPVTDYLHARRAFMKDDFDECLTLCEAAEEGLQDQVVWHARLLETRGNTLNVLGLDDEAQRTFAAAEELYRQADDPVGLASVRQNVATLRFQSDEKARELYLEALDMARGLGEPALECTILLNLSVVGHTTGMPVDEQMALLEQARALVEVDSPQLAARCQAMLLELALERGELDEATRLAESLPDPLDIVESGDRSHIAIALMVYLVAVDRPEAAVDVIDRVLPTDVQALDLHRLHAERSKALEACGRTEEALAASREAYEQVDELRKQQLTSSARALDVWHRTVLLQQDRQREKERADDLERMVAELQEATHRIHELSIRDSLTTLHNRQHLMEAGPAQIAQATEDTPAQVALVDLDRFKQINDTHGHAAGDEALRLFSQLLRDDLPPTDLVARYGGEEFVVVRPPTPGRSRPLADDLDRIRLRARSVRGEDEPGEHLPGVSLSVGVVQVTEPDLAGALLEADRRMYAAKRAGGDQVCSTAQPGAVLRSRTHLVAPVDGTPV